MKIFCREILERRFIMRLRKHLRLMRMKYEDDCFIMFGKESAGIPEEILRDNQETCVRIPMLGETRSLNLSNSVAIILYEAFRQHDFAHLKLDGHLRKYDWK